jgi:FkbM family methyltransferase
MDSFSTKAKRKVARMINAYLSSKHIFFPKRSEFGLYPAGVFHRRSQKLNVRERSFSITSFGQQGEDLILNRIFYRRLGIDPRTHHGFYMDVGAYHPISHSTSYCLYKFGWTGACVDISKTTCELIEQFRPRDRVFNVAIAHADQRKSALAVEGISLINEADYNVSGRPNDVLIDARSISSILDEIGKTDRIDYLNIDIEGAELAALEGLDFDRHRPRVISVAIHEKDMISALQSDVARKIREQGYLAVGCAAITYFFVYEGDLT